jgi:acetyl esterase/lipase
MTRIYNLPYSAHHQARRRLDVFRPDQPNGAALFFVHGGGWKAGAKESWHPVLAHFCGQGYVCATAEYRLCPETGLLGILEDLRLALAFLKDHSARWGFDPQRVAAYGSSAGGHLVGMLATVRPEDDLGVTAEMTRRDTVPQAIVAINPALSLSPLRPDLVPERMLADWPPAAGSPEPQERLRGAEPPCLIVVGDQDETTPLPMQEAAVGKLQAAGVPVELVVVPGAVHGAFYGVTSDHQRTALPAIEAFVHKWIGTSAAR